MSRWSKQVNKVFQFSSDRSDEQFLASFNKIRNYLPVNEQEKKEFDEFSLVTSSMAILIHIANADGVLKGEEHERIIESLIFQLEQRPYEYNELAEKFGKYEREIITNMYDKLLQDYKSNLINLDEIIRIIKMVYKNNHEKRYYLIRLCFYIALADFDYDIAEQKAIKEISAKLDISLEEIEKIEKEIKDDIINLK
ncbi:MAG: TerB family tellurite resistance protein [Candidatus Tenebribacter davisii]|nr:TerB family tellurite resistance protein [Candidatus Tenebribacter davisii]